MEDLLVRERYKVIRVLEVRENYAFAEAVDILDRENRLCLLNVYEGPLLRNYLPCFDRLKGCPAFLEIFLQGDSLVALFAAPSGKSIDQFFFRGDRHGWEERLAYAGRLLQAALNMADLPPQVSCAALLAENVLVDEADRRIEPRFKVVPLEGMNGRELALLTADHLKKILRPRFSAVPEELRFMDEVRRGSYTTVVQLYALWRECEDEIRRAYEDLEKKSAAGRWLALARGRAKYLLTRGRRRWRSCEKA